MTTAAQREKDEAKERLLEWLQPGDTVFTSLEHVSRSGMQRTIGLHLFRGDVRNPTHLVLAYNAATLLGYKLDRDRDGIKIGGAGMDMGFAVVYDLARVLFGDGYALNQRWI